MKIRNHGVNNYEFIARINKNIYPSRKIFDFGFFLKRFIFSHLELGVNLADGFQNHRNHNQQGSPAN